MREEPKLLVNTTNFVELEVNVPRTIGILRDMLSNTRHVGRNICFLSHLFPPSFGILCTKRQLIITANPGTFTQNDPPPWYKGEESF